MAYRLQARFRGHPCVTQQDPLPVKLAISSPEQPSGNSIQFAELPQFHIVQLSCRRNEVRYYLFGGKTTPSSGVSLIRELGYSRLTCPVFLCYLCQKNCTSVLSALDIAALGARCKGGKDFLTFGLGSDLLSRGKPVLVYCGGKSTWFRAQVEKAWYKEPQHRRYLLYPIASELARIPSAPTRLRPLIHGQTRLSGWLSTMVLWQNMDLSPTRSNGNDSQPAPLTYKSCLAFFCADAEPYKHWIRWILYHTQFLLVCDTNGTITRSGSPIPILQNVKYNSDFFKSFCVLVESSPNRRGVSKIFSISSEHWFLRPVVFSNRSPLFQMY
ncbi:hypothetical protein EV401DRAFT_1883473 [Pisolithus croceorrhizus]|nr:hypothetical protein EV401DRAFT_1883473 [Pisolithus croceorrhizus]